MNQIENKKQIRWHLYILAMKRKKKDWEENNLLKLNHHAVVCTLNNN
jgi:hypothetical protein